MSVVNRMLQDIDRRRTVAGIETPNAHTDIRSVASRSRRAPLVRRAVWVAALLIAAGAIGLSVWREVPNRGPESAVLPASTAFANQSAIQRLSPSAPAPVVAAPAASVPVEPIEKSASEPVKPQPQQQAQEQARHDAAQPSAETLKLSLKLSALVADVQPRQLTATAPLPTRKAAPSTTTIFTLPARQVAADETVLAARGMWNEGARAAALATLREALAESETTRNNRATLVLARELARLEVADNHAEDALNLLRRLEPVLGEDADAWALRGNAEQRLAMHAEAAQSYLAALRLRPTEGKWMIGAAISLAAVGKLDEAKAWVDRARERGAITPTISAYLQQLGIAMRP